MGGQNYTDADGYRYGYQSLSCQRSCEAWWEQVRRKGSGNGLEQF
ncbi:hypothetical protein [Niabella hirudinis]